MPKATGSFRITSFNEDTYEDRGDEAKLTHAWGDQAFSGDIEGDGQVHWLMSYRPDGTATYVGLQRIKGSIGGRSGSFVIDASGEFDGAASRGDMVGRPWVRSGRAEGHHRHRNVRCAGRPGSHVRARLRAGMIER